MEQTLYYNGLILTMDPHRPQADYLLTEGERITALGGAEEIAAHLAAGARPMDLQGRVLLPGFIDSHLHMLTAALNRLKLDISGMKFDTVADMLAYVKQEKQDDADPWISVFGFSEENIGDGGLVTRRDIDVYFPDVPVTVIRVCGHLSVINSKAMEKLDPEKMAHIDGGEFKKDEAGIYTGVATEGAQQYVLDTMPNPDRETILRYLTQEQELLLRCGITAIHDAGTDMMAPRGYVDVYEEMDRRGELKLRTYLMARPGDGEPAEDFAAYLSERRAAHRDGERLRIGSVKLFADGSFGGRTAAVTAPYVGEPENRGLLLKTRLNAYTRQMAEAGHQVAVHAIGDRSTDYVASLYSAVREKERLRLRIEHAELMDEALIEKVRQNHIFIMTQPIFIREFGNTYFNNLGAERAMHIQPLRSLLERGVTVGFGTDYPVDDPNPLLGIQTAMTRRIKDSTRCLNEAECIDFRQAVMCYTLHNARGAFWEESIGSLTPGKQADLVILSGLVQDEGGAVTDVSGGRVERTVIGGETVFTLEG